MNELSGLGRRFAPDENDKRYLLPRARVAPGVNWRYWNVPEILDQWDTPECVGYSCWSWLRTGPVTNRPPFTPSELYRWAQELDEWPGTDYDGSSVRGGFKALQKHGYIGEYRWAYDAEAVVAHILAKGPVVVGTAWFMDMFDTTTDGYIYPTGEDVGGHAYLLVGANRNRVDPVTGDVGAVRLVNSWGPLWGDGTEDGVGGRAWLSFHSLDWLLRFDGEACTATEIKLAVAT